MQQQKQAQGQVSHNAAQQRYEIVLDGQLAAWADYRQEEGRVRFTHTQVQQAHESQGLGTRLVQGALDDVRRRGMQAVPQCPFVASFVQRHEKDYGDLVAR